MTQTARLLQLLKDHKPHRTDEILREVYGSEHLGIARIGARINDLKKLGHDNVGITTRRIGSCTFTNSSRRRCR